MPTDPNTLLEQAKCIECAIPAGMQLPVLIAIADGISTPKPPCTNLIPSGALYGGGFSSYALLFVNQGLTYTFTFGENDADLVNGSDTIPSPGVGKTITFTSQQEVILIGTSPGIPVTGILCAV